VCLLTILCFFAELLLPEQALHARDESTTYRGLSVDQLLAQLKHYNPKVQREAAYGLRDLWQKQAATLTEHVATILQTILPLSASATEVVTQATESLLEEILLHLGDASAAFIDLSAAYIEACLTSPSRTARRSGVMLILVWLKTIRSEIVLPRFGKMISIMLPLLRTSQIADISDLLNALNQLVGESNSQQLQNADYNRTVAAAVWNSDRRDDAEHGALPVDVARDAVRRLIELWMEAQPLNKQSLVYARNLMQLACAIMARLAPRPNVLNIASWTNRIDAASADHPLQHELGKDVPRALLGHRQLQESAVENAVGAELNALLCEMLCYFNSELEIVMNYVADALPHSDAASHSRLLGVAAYGVLNEINRDAILDAFSASFRKCLTVKSASAVNLSFLEHLMLPQREHALRAASLLGRAAWTLNDALGARALQLLSFLVRSHHELATHDVIAPLFAAFVKRQGSERTVLGPFSEWNESSQMAALSLVFYQPAIPQSLVRALAAASLDGSTTESTVRSISTMLIECVKRGSLDASELFSFAATLTQRSEQLAQHARETAMRELNVE
jgi:hypothetical protein